MFANVVDNLRKRRKVCRLSRRDMFSRTRRQEVNGDMNMEWDIYWSDLRPEIQQQILDAAGINLSPEEFETNMNWDVFPMTSIIVGGEDDE